MLARRHNKFAITLHNVHREFVSSSGPIPAFSYSKLRVIQLSGSFQLFLWYPTVFAEIHKKLRPLIKQHIFTCQKSIIDTVDSLILKTARSIKFTQIIKRRWDLVLWLYVCSELQVYAHLTRNNVKDWYSSPV